MFHDYRKYENINFIGPCTKRDWTDYWCMTQIASPQKIVNFTVDSWGECSLSCLDPNLDKTPLITNYKFSANLMNNLEIGSGNPGKSTDSSLKGEVSDFYLWNFPISSETIQNFAFCKEENNVFDMATISWLNWENYWSLDLNGNSLVQYEETRHKLCRRQEFKMFIGFSTQMNFREAIRQCNSFGGTLPLPLRFVMFHIDFYNFNHFIVSWID